MALQDGQPDPYGLPPIDLSAYDSDPWYGLAPPAPVDLGITATESPMMGSVIAQPPPPPPPPEPWWVGPDHASVGPETASVPDVGAELPPPGPPSLGEPSIAPQQTAPAQLPPPPPPPMSAPQPGIGLPAGLISGAMAAPDGARDLEAPTDPSQDIAALNDEQYAQYKLAQQIASRERMLADQAKAAQAEREQAERDHVAAVEANKRAQEESAAIADEAKKLGNERIDPEHWWSTRSSGQQIAAVLGAFVAGMVRARKGGSNVVLDTMDREIDRDIAAQQANIANRRAALGERKEGLSRSISLDANAAAEATKFRVATYERAINESAAREAAFDPRGTRAQAERELRDQMRARQAEAIQRFNDQRRKTIMEDIKFRQDAEKHALDMAKGQADLARKLGAVGGTGAVKPDEQVQDPSYFAQRGLIAPPVPMSPAQYKAWQPLKKGSQEITANQTTGMSKEEIERGIDLPGGDSFIAKGRPEDAAKLRTQIAAAKEIIDLMDDALTTRTGWSTDLGNSEERQQLVAIWGNAKIAAKNLNDLGAITEADVPLIKGAIGTDDPSKLRDPTPGIRKARELVLNKVNNLLRGAGYKGRWDVRPLPGKGGAATVRPGDAEQAALLKGPSLDQVAGELGASPLDGADVAAKFREAGGILPSARRTIDALAAGLRSTDPREVELAATRLRELAAHADLPAVRQYAMDQLGKLALPTSEPASDPNVGKSVVRDEVAGPR